MNVQRATCTTKKCRVRNECSKIVQSLQDIIRQTRQYIKEWFFFKVIRLVAELG